MKVLPSLFNLLSSDGVVSNRAATDVSVSLSPTYNYGSKHVIKCLNGKRENYFLRASDALYVFPISHECHHLRSPWISRFLIGLFKWDKGANGKWFKVDLESRHEIPEIFHRLSIWNLLYLPRSYLRPSTWTFEGNCAKLQVSCMIEGRCFLDAAEFFLVRSQCVTGPLAHLHKPAEMVHRRVSAK
jgi:hypothetical protein